MTSERRRVPVGLARALVLTVAASAILSAAAARPVGDPNADRRVEHASPVPPRPASPLSDVELWEQARDAERRAVGNHRQITTAEVVVGLKSAGSRRGVWRNQILIDSERLTHAKEHLLARTRATVLYEDDLLPAMVLELPNVAALAAIRRLPIVDYVEPNYTDTRIASIGCTAPDLDDETVRQQSAKDAYGDVLPWSLPYHSIPQAWERIRTGPSAGPGADRTVAVIDTGLLRGQTQLQMPRFAAGQSTGRSVANLGSNTWDGGDTPWSTCDHGTRVAGLIAAPRDGQNIVGIAWKTNLVTVNALDSVVVGSGNAAWVARAITLVRERGASIINMSFGNHLITGSMYLIEDKIRYEYYRLDAPSVLFVGAAGTTFCPFGAVAWPAYLPEVIAVAGVARDRYSPVYGESCYGDAVDTAAVVDTGNVETPGVNADDYIGLGASSGATATISGILALIWAEHPDWDRNRVRDRLYASGQGFRDLEIGYGVPNAYAAVGGFARLSIKAPKGYEPGVGYTLSANTSLGDGPFTYLWSTGETTATIHRVGPNAPSQKTTLTVTDTREGKSMTTSVTLKPYDDDPPPCWPATRLLPPCP